MTLPLNLEPLKAERYAHILIFHRLIPCQTAMPARCERLISRQAQERCETHKHCGTVDGDEWVVVQCKRCQTNKHHSRDVTLTQRAGP